MGKTKTKTTTNQTSNVNTTTTPQNAPWVEPSVTGRLPAIDALAGQVNSNPYQFVAPANDLQGQAYSGAQSLGGWQPSNIAAQLLTLNNYGQGPNLGGRQGPSRSSSLPLPANDGGFSLNDAGAFTYTPPQIPNVTLGGANQATPATMNPATLGPAPRGQSQGFSAPTLAPSVSYDAALIGAPQLGQAQGYSPTMAGAAQAGSQGYTAQTMNAPTLAAAQGYSAADAGEAAQVGDVSSLLGGPARAGYTSLLDNLQSYMNPYINDVVNTSLAQYDDAAGQARARLAASGAARGAFGGSRFGIREGQFEADLLRDRAAMEAGLRSDAFGTGAGLSLQDAAARQAINLANTGWENENILSRGSIGLQGRLADTASRNAFALDRAGRTDAASAFTSAAGNARNLRQGELDFEALARSMDWVNRASEFGAGAANTAELANAGYRQQTGIRNADAADSAARFGADWGNQFGVLGAQLGMEQARLNQSATMQARESAAQAENARRLAQGQYDFGAAAQSNDYANRFGLQEMDLAGQYGLRAGDYAQEAARTNAANDQQTRLQNNDWLNRFTGQQGEMDMQRVLAQAGLTSDALRYAAESNNNMSQFNAQQRDAAMQRNLQALGLLGSLSDSYAGNQRADVGTQAQVGDQAWNRDNYLAGWPLQAQAQVNSLYAPVWGAADLFRGSNTQGTETTNGTSTSVQSQGFGSVLGGLLGAGLSGWASGGFGLPFKL